MYSFPARAEPFVALADCCWWLTDSEGVEAAADDDGDGQQLAEAEHVLHGGRQLDAQAVDQRDDAWNRFYRQLTIMKR